MTTSLARSRENLEKLKAWAESFISEAEANARGLVMITRKQRSQSWQRMAVLFEFFQAERQAGPILVILDDGRAALFVEKRTQVKPVTRRAVYQTRNLSLIDRRKEQVRRQLPSVTTISSNHHQVCDVS